MSRYSCPALWARRSVRTAARTVKSLSPWIYAAAFIQRFLPFRLYFKLSHSPHFYKVPPEKEAE